MRTAIGHLLLVAALAMLAFGLWEATHGRVDGGFTRWGTLILALWYNGSRRGD